MSKSRYKTRKKKQDENKRRFDAIKDLMSTFAMTTVAVVAAVTLIPSSPKAEIIKAISLTDEIVYQVNVTDEDNALDLDTLVVVLENQLEYYEQPIQLGDHSGYFDSLENNTEYRLSVYGSKGFGQERLDTLLISTDEKEGGTILSVTPPDIELDTNYIIDVSIADPDSKYTSIDLYYGHSWEPDVPIQYSSVSITEPRVSLELWDLSTSYPSHIYLEGTTLDGTELLDEIWVTPPYEFHTYVYMDYIDSNEIGFYSSGYMDIHDIAYKMNVYLNGMLTETRQISMTQGHMESSNFVIDKLSPNTTYEFECIAIYKDPNTLRTEEAVVYLGELTTLDVYSYSYTLETVGEYIELTITLIDSNDYFDVAYYDAYDNSGDQAIYIDSDTYTIIDTGSEKTVTLSILLSVASDYDITIGIRSNNISSINKILEINIEN